MKLKRPPRLRKSLRGVRLPRTGLRWAALAAVMATLVAVSSAWGIYTGMQMYRARMATTASNVANAHTTRTASGGAYRRRDPVFRTEPVGGAFAGRLERAIQRVEVERVVLDRRAPITRFDPGHPDADAEGYAGDHDGCGIEGDADHTHQAEDGDDRQQVRYRGKQGQPY